MNIKKNEKSEAAETEGMCQQAVWLARRPT